MSVRKIHFAGVRPFDLEVHCEETRSYLEEEHFEPHTHRNCEIYINLSGDVSFMVENRVYPIAPGCVILTRPDEFHHCIYHSFRESHRHYCIQFSPIGNEALLHRFFDRKPGTENLICLGAEELREAESLCRVLLDESEDELLRYGTFFSLLTLLRTSRATTLTRSDAILPPDVRIALDYVQARLPSPITVAELAAEAHVSVNTLERHFLAAMQVTPSEFLKERRLATAQALLRDGRSVLEACEGSGFSDYSYFIALFRRRFGVTPLRYKKQWYG